MPSSWVKTLIIVVLLVLTGPLLTACSALRLGYNNGAQLAWWWLDAYVDFSSEQAPAAKRAIDRWFDWHRATQLPEYVATLASLQAQVQEPTTPALACAWQDRLRGKLDPAIDRAINEFADLLPGLGEPQFTHLAQRYAKGNAEMRDDFLQPDTAERLKESVKRTVKRAEQLYGTLDETQLKVIHAGVQLSPFNPDLWVAERQRRQRDTLQTLRRLVADKADRDARAAALRALAARTERSPLAEYRAYQVKLAEYNCGLAAQIHNATTAAQRQKARDTLKGWEEDLRSLVAPAS
jgi:hypothetical protein